MEARRVGLVRERCRGRGCHVEPDRGRAGVRQREGLVGEVVGLALDRLGVRDVGAQLLHLTREGVAAGVERRRVLRHDRDLLGVQHLHEVVGDQLALDRVIDGDAERPHLVLSKVGRSLDLDVGHAARVQVLADGLLVLEPIEHDDREDVIVLDQLLRLVFADLGLRLRVLDDHLDLAAADAALGVDVAPVGVDTAVELNGDRRGTGDGQQVPDRDLRVGDTGCRARPRFTAADRRTRHGGRGTALRRCADRRAGILVTLEPCSAGAARKRQGHDERDRAMAHALPPQTRVVSRYRRSRPLSSAARDTVTRLGCRGRCDCQSR